MSNNKPTHRAFIVRNYQAENGAEKAHWTAIGSVWPHKDGKGFDVTLAAFPVDGRLVIRVDEPKPATVAEGGAP
jgi:hypothetical protein